MESAGNNQYEEELANKNWDFFNALFRSVFWGNLFDSLA